MLPAERVVRSGEDVSFDILPLTDVAGGQLDGVLHQFSHDGALELAWVVLPLLLLSEFLDDNLVSSVSQVLEPAQSQCQWISVEHQPDLPLHVHAGPAQGVLHPGCRVAECLQFERSLETSKYKN